MPSAPVPRQQADPRNDDEDALTCKCPLHRHVDGSDNHGFCMYHSRLTGKLHAFVTANGGGSIQHLRCSTMARGCSPQGRFEPFPSRASPGAASPMTISAPLCRQEDVAIWKYGAEPDAGSTSTSVEVVGDSHLAADIDEMAIAHGAEDSGYLFVSSQGTRPSPSRTGTAPMARESINVVANVTINAASGTDGLDVTSQNVGPVREGHARRPRRVQFGRHDIEPETRAARSDGDVVAVGVALRVRLGRQGADGGRQPTMSRPT